jgi:tetratricopeptide (TPR) repeat protein
MNKTNLRSGLRVFISAAAVLITAAVYANNLSFMSDISVKDSGASGALAPFADDAFSGFVNPAGLGFTPKQEAGFMYYNLFEGSIISSFSYAYPILGYGTLGVSLAYLSIPGIIERDDNNVPGGRFDEAYADVMLSYGISLASFVNAGINIKYLNHMIDTDKPGAYGVDLGAVFLLPYNIRFSARCENAVKPEFKYASGAVDYLPFSFDATIGTGFKLFSSLNDSLKIGAGMVNEETSTSPVLHAGAEYSLYNGVIAARGGYRDGGFSFGGSILLYGVSIDYAYIKMPLDFIHRFSLTYSFGGNIREIEDQTRTTESKLKYELIQKIRQGALEEFKSSIIDSLTKGDLETAQITVQKALVWAPYDDWFTGKEKEINSLLNKDKKERLIKEADTMIKNDSYIDAMIALKNVLEIDPNNADAKAKFDRAQQFVKTLGEKNIAVEEGNKDTIKKHFESGLDSYADGNYEQAILEWNKVIQASPLQRQVYSFIKKAEDKVKKKEDQARSTQELHKQKISELYNQAVILHTQGKFEESINVWREILSLDPGNKEAKDYLDKVTDEYKKIQRQNLGW